MKLSTHTLSRLSALALAMLSFGVCAQQFPIPQKPIRIVTPAPPGISADLTARAIAQQLAASLGVPVVVENKPGASFLIGTMEVVRAPPDGHTILWGASSIATALPHSLAKAPFDPFTDLTPIMYGARVPLVLVGATSASFSTLDQFIAHARANPGKLNFATPAVGSGFDIAFEQVKRWAGIDVQVVPYKGGAQALQALMSGQVQLQFLLAGDVDPLRKSGKINAFAVADDTRFPKLPDVPTFDELGASGIDTRGSLHFFGPAKLPRQIVDRLNVELGKALKTPAVEQIFESAGLPIVGSTPEVQVAYLRSQYERWGEMIRKLGIRVE